MVLKGILAALVCTAVLAWSAPSWADAYSPDDFLKLDLSKAVLSPKPLGPPNHFEPVAVEAKADAAVAAAPVHAAKRRVAAVRTKPAAVRTKLARKHGNPLDAEAFDTRIQVWPCRSGGICNWRRQGTQSN
jgi:hypothetical protein